MEEWGVRGVGGSKVSLCLDTQSEFACPHATTASWNAIPAGMTGSSSHALLHLVAQLVKFNEDFVELVNGDLDAVVDKLNGVQKDVRKRAR